MPVVCFSARDALATYARDAARRAQKRARDATQVHPPSSVRPSVATTCAAPSRRSRGARVVGFISRTFFDAHLLLHREFLRSNARFFE